MKLSEIIKYCNFNDFEGNPEGVLVNSIEYDSRKVTKNSLFAAIKGFKTDGHLFIEAAVNNGASAVVIEETDEKIDECLRKNNIVKIKVENSRKSMAVISDLFYGYPSKKLKLIGVTGTKGKTSTTFFLKKMFETAGFKC